MKKLILTSFLVGLTLSTLGCRGTSGIGTAPAPQTLPGPTVPPTPPTPPTKTDLSADEVRGLSIDEVKAKLHEDTFPIHLLSGSQLDALLKTNLESKFPIAKLTRTQIRSISDETLIHLTQQPTFIEFPVASLSRSQVRALEVLDASALNSIAALKGFPLDYTTRRQRPLLEVELQKQLSVPVRDEDDLSEFEKLEYKILENHLVGTYTPLTFSMSEAQVKTAVREFIEELEQNPTNLFSVDHIAIESPFFRGQKLVTLKNGEQWIRKSRQLDRFLGYRYLKALINKHGMKHFDVVEKKLVRNTTGPIDIVVNAYDSSLKSFRFIQSESYDTFARFVKGTHYVLRETDPSEELKREAAILFNAGFVDWDPGNLIKSDDDGKIYIIDTELKSFEEMRTQFRTFIFTVNEATLYNIGFKAIFKANESKLKFSIAPEELKVN